VKAFVKATKKKRSLGNRLKRYNIKKAQFDSRKAELSKRFGQEPSDTDVIWGVLNDRTVEIARKGRLTDQDLHDLKMNCRLKALLLHDEGEDPHELLREAAKWELMRLQQTPWITGVKIFTCKNACSACQKQRGKVFTIAAALKKMPIPHKKCVFEHNGKRGWCRCFYTAVLTDTDEVVKQIRGRLWGK